MKKRIQTFLRSTPAKEITVESLISGHHRENDFCPLIGGVCLYEIHIFDLLWPREGYRKGSKFLGC